MPTYIVPKPVPGAKIYLTADAAERLYKINRPHLRKNVTPDAWSRSGDGSKTNPLWLESTIKAYAAEYFARRNAEQVA